MGMAQALMVPIHLEVASIIINQTVIPTVCLNKGQDFFSINPIDLAEGSIGLTNFGLFEK